MRQTRQVKLTALGKLKNWFSRRRETRTARRRLGELFDTPEILAGTSLKPRHGGRWIYLGHETDGGEVARIRFGILRHPRPYAFSRQSHKVIEYYTYDVLKQEIGRERGVNITRARGKDDD